MKPGTVAPMLAKLARELPVGPGWRYEPKFDGFRALAFRDGGDVDIRSRNQRPFSRYFPELVEALSALATQRVVLDGEIVADDFSRLMLRLHPSPKRVLTMRDEILISYVGFDVLAARGDDLTDRPFAERRAVLESVLDGAPAPLLLAPSTDDPAVAAEWLQRFTGQGIDGVVAKHDDLRYEPGRRSMVKVKHARTADCVVAGVRLHLDRPVVASLLLGLYDDEGVLRHVGVVSSFTEPRRVAMVDELAPYVTEPAGHPWEHGFALEGGPMGRLPGSAGRWRPDMDHDWVPLRPELVCEVSYDQVEPNGRWRHPGRFVRWRPDRDPRTCLVAQLFPERDR